MDNEKERVQKNAAAAAAWENYGEKRELISKLESLKETLEEKKELLEEAKYKAVLDDIDKKELFKNLKIRFKFEHHLNLPGELTISFKNTYDKDLPSDYDFVMDGTVQVKVFCDGIFVENVCVPLPLNGVPCYDGKGEKTVHMTKYMIDSYDRKMTFECSPNNLWIMEA